MQKIVVLGPKILIFTEESKGFGTHMTENHLGTSFALFFSGAWDQMDQKGQYWAKNANFGTNFAIYGPKINLGNKTFGTLIAGNQ